METDVHDDAAEGHWEQVYSDHERGVFLDVLHKEGDPEPHDGKGEVPEQENDNYEREIAILPDSHGNERIWVPALPKDEDGNRKGTDNKKYENIGCLPALRSARTEATLR